MTGRWCRRTLTPAARPWQLHAPWRRQRWIKRSRAAGIAIPGLNADNPVDHAARPCEIVFLLPILSASRRDARGEGAPRIRIARSFGLKGSEADGLAISAVAREVDRKHTEHLSI